LKYEGKKVNELIYRLAALVRQAFGNIRKAAALLRGAFGNTWKVAAGCRKLSGGAERKMHLCCMVPETSESLLRSAGRFRV